MTAPKVRELRGLWLGRRPYAPVYDLQRRLQQRRLSGAAGDTVLLLEHEPVITLGRGARAGNLLAPRELLESRGVDLVTTDRGGDVTVHGPGQLVAYPILDLRPDRCDVRRYVNDLAETMRRVALRHGVSSGTVEGLVGLWVDADAPSIWRGGEHAGRLAKLGAIGVRLSRWITLHGFALNLTTDLGLFDLIVPCGISQHGVTSIVRLNGRRPDVREEASHALEALAEVLQARALPVEDRSNEPLDSIAT